MSASTPPQTPQPGEALPNGRGLERILAGDNVSAAWERVRTNAGAPGPDGLSIDQIASRFPLMWQPVAEAVRNGTWRIGGLRDVPIPKATGGTRLLRIPNVLDRVVLQAIAQVLCPVWEPFFKEQSHGYRKGRGVRSALDAASACIAQGRPWGADLDIENFFDRVDHAALIALVAPVLGDGPAFGLVKAAIHSGAFPESPDGRPRGIPQGSPLSPLLANIALHPLDCEMAKQGMAFVRYADDILITGATPAAIGAAIAEVGAWLSNSLKLSLNPDKTQLCPVESLSFLGFSFVKNESGAIRPALSEASRKAFEERVEAVIREKGHLPPEDLAGRLGDYVSGWGRFFGYGAAQVPLPWKHLLGFARTRARAAFWAAWGTPQRRLQELLKRGVPAGIACRDAGSPLPPNEAANLHALGLAFPNEWFERHGVCATTWGGAATTPKHAPPAALNGQARAAARPCRPFLAFPPRRRAAQRIEIAPDGRIIIETDPNPTPLPQF